MQPQSFRRADPARTPSTPALASGTLHRAIVSLPLHLCEPNRPLQDRIVFFEAPHGARCDKHLETLLAAAWCEDTTDWCERGFIYNINTARELLRDWSIGNQASGDLRLFETGAGGDCAPAVGPDRIHYARAADVDMFVTPRVAARLRATLAHVEHLYDVEPTRLAAVKVGHEVAA